MKIILRFNFTIFFLAFIFFSYSPVLSQNSAKIKNLSLKKAKNYFENKRYNDARKNYIIVAEICEEKKWTGAGSAYEWAAICFEKTNNILNALKTYKKSKISYEKEGLDIDANRIKKKIHYLNKEYLREKLKENGDWDSWMWLTFLKIISNYGTDPLKLLYTMVLIVIIFSLIYYPFFPSKSQRIIKFKNIEPNKGVKGAIKNYFSTLQMSAMIFGGLLYPTAENNATKIIVIIETTLGYFLLAIFIAVLVVEILD